MASIFQEQTTGFVPLDDNPIIVIARQADILGGFHQYDDLQGFLNLHPNKMKVGMEAIVNQHNRPSGDLFKAKTYKLDKIPSLNEFPLSSNNGDANFYLNFWTLAQEFEATEIATVYQYAPDINGLKPPFPYIDNPSAESAWTSTYTPGESQWLRSRSTSRQFDGSAIYKDWTIPLPINGNFEQGDFTANLFLRAASEPPLPPSTIDGLPNNEPEGWADVPPAGTDPLYEIRGQKDKFGNLLSQWIGPFLIPEDEDLIRYNANSTPNPNTLASTTESATDGTQANTDLVAAGWVASFDPTIHKYRAKRTETSPGVYTTWDIVKIANESGEYIDRIYKLFPVNADFDSNTFKTNNTPTGNDPIANTQQITRNEGWSDVQQEENNTEVNYYSEARKFIDGSLKTSWTAPKPFTGKDTYIDLIRSNGETTFKYPDKSQATYTSVGATYADIAALLADQGNQTEDTLYRVTDASTDPNISSGTAFYVFEGIATADLSDYTLVDADPKSITLTSLVFKGNQEITTGLTYKWFKIYNNRNAIAVDPEVDTPLSTSKDLTVYPIDIATKAIFRCYTTLATSDQNIEFIEEESIVDITDGDDAKSLTLSSETPIVLYDTSNTVFSVDTIRLRAFQNFLTGVTFYWYKDDGAGNWVSLDGNTDYTLTNQSLSILADNTANPDAGLFTPDGTKENARFAISTADLPADVENVDEFYDVFTISKLSSAGVGAAGQDAYTVVLSNEVDSAILDRATLLPQSGEIGQTGTVSTKVKVFDGTTQLTAGTDFTVSVASSETDISFTALDEGVDYLVYIDTWTATTVRKVTGVITVTITAPDPDVVITKNFTVTTNLDDAGAIIPFVDVAGTSTNPTLTFSPGDRSDITLQAILDQNGTNIPAADWDGNVVWFFNGVTTSSGFGGVNRKNKIVSRTDVVNALSVKAKITYNGNEYFTTPVTIDDITDSKQYIVYHRYATAPTLEDEPLAIPSAPDNITVDAFNALGDNDELATASRFFKTPNINSYWYSLGTASKDGTDDIISWEIPIRNRGERGEQGPTPDFVVTYYKVASSIPTIALQTASRDVMLAAENNSGVSDGTTYTGEGWYPTPALARDATPIGDLYEASTTFNGTQVNDLEAAATNPWGITLKTAQDGFDAWQPVFNTPLLPSGEAYVVEVIDWFGGDGTKPAINVYLSDSGYTSDINQATRLFPFAAQEFSLSPFTGSFKTGESGYTQTAMRQAAVAEGFSNTGNYLNGWLVSSEYDFNLPYESVILATIGDGIPSPLTVQNYLAKIRNISVPGTRFWGDNAQIDTVVGVLKPFTNTPGSIGSLTTELVFSTTLTGKDNYGFDDIFSSNPSIFDMYVSDLVDTPGLFKPLIVIGYPNNNAVPANTTAGSYLMSFQNNNELFAADLIESNNNTVNSLQGNINALNTFSTSISDAFTQSAGAAPSYSASYEVLLEVENLLNSTNNISIAFSLLSTGPISYSSGGGGTNDYGGTENINSVVQLQPNETKTFLLSGSGSFPANIGTFQAISGSINVDFEASNTSNTNNSTVTFKSYKIILDKLN